jgi:hypothetical protein
LACTADEREALIMTLMAADLAECDYWERGLSVPRDMMLTLILSLFLLTGDMASLSLLASQ